MAEWETYTDTDGATLPAFFRKWIENKYPSEVIELIDRAGRFHDWLTFKYPNTKTHNRHRFIKLLKRYGVPRRLRIMINIGLWVYDTTPSWISRKLKQNLV